MRSSRSWIIPRENGEFPVLHLPYLAAEPVQKVPVVGDHQQRPLVGGQILLQPAQGLKVQVVGGLVQYQEAGLFQQQLGDGQPGLLPAAEFVDALFVPVGGEAHTSEDGVDLYLGLVSVPGQEGVLQFFITIRQGGGLRVAGHFLGGFLQLLLQGVDIGKDRAHLLQDGVALLEPGVLPLVADGKAAAPGDGAAVRLQPPGDDVQQGGLARPVDAHQPDAVPVLDPGADPGEDEVAAKGLGDIFQ